MLAALLLSAFAVYGFFSLLLDFTERCCDAVAVRADEREHPKSLLHRLRLVSRCKREVVIISDGQKPSEELFALGYAVYLRVSEEKGDRDDGNAPNRARDRAVGDG